MRTNLSFGLIQLPCHRPRQKKFNTLDFEIFCQRHTEFCSPPSHFSGFLQPFYGLFSSRFCPGLTAFFPIMFYFLLISTCNISDIFLYFGHCSLHLCFILPFSIWKATLTVGAKLAKWKSYNWYMWANGPGNVSPNCVHIDVCIIEKSSTLGNENSC